MSESESEGDEEGTVYVGESDGGIIYVGESEKGECELGGYNVCE